MTSFSLNLFLAVHLCNFHWGRFQNVHSVAFLVLLFLPVEMLPILQSQSLNATLFVCGLLLNTYIWIKFVSFEP